MSWIIFAIIIVVMLGVDLYIITTHPHVLGFKEAVRQSLIWIGIAVMFGIGVYFYKGVDAGNMWFSAYVIEKSLSMDNLFVMYLIFQYFQTPQEYQQECLFWGILGAMILRATFIFLGATLVAMFHPILYIFGVVLIWSAYKLVFNNEEEASIKENKVVLFFMKHFPVEGMYFGNKFFLKVITDKVRISATLLFITLLMIETTDIIFAIDSIPAAFGITTDTFILYTSNILAVLGLRALYFVMASLVNKLWALKYGIAIVLAFVGVKMCIDHFVEIPTIVSLIIVLSVLLISGLLSTIKKLEPVKA